MAFVRHLQVTLQSATFNDPLSSSLDERMVYVKASHKNVVYTTSVVEGVGNVELHHMWGNDGTNVFHFTYEDNSEDITLELFNRDHICIGISRLHLAGLAKVMPEQDPELKILPVSALGRLRTHGSLALTAQIKRQQAMGKLGNLNVVLQEGIINSISTTESGVFAKLIYKHTTYTIGVQRGERNKFVWLEHFTFRINSWEPADVLDICIYSGAFQVGECKVLLSLFINLEENFQADRKDLVIRTEDLLVGQRSVGSIKVAGSFSTLHELDVLRAIVKEKGPESHSARIPPLELPGMTNYASITNDIRGEGEIEADIFHTDKSKSKAQLEFKEIWNAGKPTSIGDYLPIDLARDLLGASSRGYVIRASCSDGQGGQYSCALKRIDTMDESEPDLARLCHPHVVHLFHYWKKRIDNGEVHEWMPEPAFMTFLMMELMDGDLGNLLTSIKTSGLTPFSLLVAVDLMLQIAEGMLYLHEIGVSHPHLNCSNVLCRVKSTAQIPFRVGDVLLKLGGFGCPRAANDDTKKRDVLCFGLTCLEILTGDQCFEDIYGADKVSRPNISETTPCILKDCIASCLDTKITFSEAITLLLLAQSQIVQTCGEGKMISCNVNLNIKSTLSNNQDKASSSTSKGDRQEMFHVHQLHPQMGEVATSVQITLIFFHGFPKVSEEWRMTWLTRDNRLVWPQMWLPEDLDGDIRVLSVSFDDRPDVSSSQSIKDLLSDLLQALVMSATCKLGDTDQAIVLVGHSFGGVIIKALVAAAQGLAGKTVENKVEFQEVLECKKFLKRLARIVFYSVPHAFTNWEFEKYISGCSNTRVLQRSFLLKALRRDGVFISDMVQLSRDFENAVPRKTKVLAFLEGKPMSKKSLLVTENSGEGLLLSWEWHKIDRDNHFEVCRPVSKSHIGYKVLLNHLQEHMCSPSAVNVRRVWKVLGTVLICICKFKEVLSRYRILKCSSLTKETEDSVAGRLGKRHNPMDIFTSPGYLNYDSVDGPTQRSMSANFHSSPGSSGIPDLAATSGASRQFFGFLADNMQDDVKKEEGSDGHARIGLNLGVRSYFSTEDSTAGGPGMRHSKCSPGSQVPTCQAEGCKADLSTAKHYHRRHEVCEFHSKAPTVTVGGHTQRFCEQCSSFHRLSEFNKEERSCRRCLADYNRRLLKPLPNARKNSLARFLESRKRQLNASNLKRPPAESTGIKAIKAVEDGDLHSDPKSIHNMFLQKNCGSPSSVSLEDSNEEPGTPGVGNLQMRTAGPGFDSRVLTSALKDAEKVIMHWDMDYATSHRWIFESAEEDARTYLNAVDILTELESKNIHNRDPQLLEEAQHLLQLAMKRLEEELRHVLERHTGFLDPDVFIDSFSAKSFRGEEEDEEHEDEREEEEEKDKEDGDEEKLQVRKLERMQSKAVALLPAQAAEDVLAIVTRLIAGGFEKECMQVYTSSRKIVLERSLETLGVERMSIEEVPKMPWEVQVEKVREWNQAMKVGVSVLFASEKKLCDLVFAPPLADICFNEFASSKMLHLLSFGKAIALSPRSPEKLFKVLDMYGTLRFLIPDIELTFSGTFGTSVRSSASDVLSYLGEAARATFMDFEVAIERDRLRIPDPDGSVHPFTRYVMTYIKFACDYTDTLELAYGETTQTLARTPALTSSSPRSHHSNSPDDRSTREGASLLANQIRDVAQVLQANLGLKAWAHEDEALGQVFLMNNIHYMVQEVKSSEVLFSFFGDTWEKKQAGMVRAAAAHYQQVAWRKALSCLRVERLPNESGFSFMVYSQAKLKKFNTIVDEVHRTQSQWVVLDPILRDELRISIANEVLPAYRAFLVRYRHIIVTESESHRVEDIKYSVEGLEVAIREFFNGRVENIQHSAEGLEVAIPEFFNGREKAADSSKLASRIEKKSGDIENMKDGKLGRIWKPTGVPKKI